MESAQSINIDLGHRSYDIHLGQMILQNAASFVAPHLKRPKVVIVTDDNVSQHHLTTVRGSFEQNEIPTDTVILQHGERTKSFSELENLCNQLIELEVERSDIIIALGGGVIGDITGFAAAILRRGCRFIQIPTTLLAQVDSSVGGKTAINAKSGKNLIGAFHQPEMVLIDLEVLSTLPKRELLAGYAEILKYALISDPAFFNWLDQNLYNVISRDLVQLQQAIATSVKMKSNIVSEDELEHGKRALLNLGHTFGHALEAEMGYSSDLLHGEAVAIGMVLAHDFSAECGHCSDSDAAAVKAHLARAKLPTSMHDIPGLSTSSSRLMEHIAQDKKVSQGKLTFILTNGIGKAFIDNDVCPTKLEAFLNSQM